MLRGFGVWESAVPDGINDPRTQAEMEPRMRRMGSRKFELEGDLHPDMPKPPKVYLNHVMLFERVGDVIERKAAGLMVQRAVGWSECKEFCLG